MFFSFHSLIFFCLILFFLTFCFYLMLFWCLSHLHSLCPSLFISYCFISLLLQYQYFIIFRTFYLGILSVLFLIFFCVSFLLFSPFFFLPPFSLFVYLSFFHGFLIIHFFILSFSLSVFLCFSFPSVLSSYSCCLFHPLFFYFFLSISVSLSFPFHISPSLSPFLPHICDLTIMYLFIHAYKPYNFRSCRTKLETPQTSNPAELPFQHFGGLHRDVL